MIYTVAGIYENGQRYADSFEADNPAHAEKLVPAGVAVAGVFEGELNAADAADLPEWTDATYTGDGAALLNEAPCPRCSHDGRHHSPEVGCLVQAGDYCPCGLRPFLVELDDLPSWMVANAQDPADACPRYDEDECKHAPCITAAEIDAAEENGWLDVEWSRTE